MASFAWRSLRSWAVVAVCSALSCAAPRLSLQSDVEPPGTSFSSTYERWTRIGRLISKTELDTVLVTSATLRSRAFQRAYAERYIKVYGLVDPAEQQRVRSEALAQSDAGIGFYVQTTTHDQRWNDLSPKKARWRVTLLDENGHQREAAEITALASNAMVESSLLGQSPDPFRRTWHVRFPSDSTPGLDAASVPRARRLTLRIAGPEGTVDLSWALE